MTQDEWSDGTPNGFLVIYWTDTGEQKLLVPKGEGNGDMPPWAYQFLRAVSINSDQFSELAEELDQWIAKA